MIVLIVGNIRLLVENYIKYGLLASFERMSGIPDHDIKIALLLTAFIPGHLFVSLVVERVAASWALTLKPRGKIHKCFFPRKLLLRTSRLKILVKEFCHPTVFNIFEYCRQNQDEAPVAAICGITRH